MSEYRPLLCRDEETDIRAFQAYLAGLPADALWDVRSHLDAERYPRRAEAVTREITRRRLLFVSPYTPRETRLRRVFALCLVFAVLAAVLRPVGGMAWAPPPGAHVPLVQDLALGGPVAAHLLLPFVRVIAGTFLLATAVGVLEAAYLRAKRRLSAEVLGLGIAALIVAACLLLLSCRP